jgi:GNAT superfamily N-acetyltransferase
MDLRKETTANLYRFYGAIATLSGTGEGEICGIPYAGIPAAGWPAYIFGGEEVDADTMDTVAEAMKEGKVPPFWIRERNPQEGFDALAETRGIRLISQWTGMHLEVRDSGNMWNSHVQEAVSRGSAVRQVVPEELPAWLDLVNTEVMTSMKIGWSRIVPLAGSEKFHFFGLWHKDALVSTALLYHDRGIAGLYFIATKSSQRGHGFGRAVVSAAIAYGNSQGISKFVLHSTPMGISLYKKLGFVENTTYGIYWMLGKR